MPCPLKNSCCVYNKLDDKIVIIGGWDENETLNKMFTFDPRQMTSYFSGFLPKPVEGHSLAIFDDFVFIIGGFDGFGVTDRIMILNLKTGHAELIETKLKQKRENHTS